MIDIPGYEGLYAATKDGRIWSHKSWIFMVLKDHHGYLKVGLRKNNKQTHYFVHRLIAATYLGLVLDNLEVDVDHDNKIKSDNFVSNLKIITHLKNCQLRNDLILEDDTDTHKWCRKCKILKLRLYFSKNSAHKDGLGGTCKSCNKLKGK